ncbi:YqaJ viral recombinase family protein [Rhodococcus sp. (in: high G+C Gram-positive bacteria)]|uniref:YqaJ viral recombinase family protein n=1 Tax=Rhodococcus sp. TaxID=1831 RepID=UPI0025801A47|nr:YqaJ viral recombinase family protein [Rhodococcus sp. (in: high G+C Gram-positive bacteria)]MBQ9051720.1 YqaJ viral recombinase family protein [Rhodococcus sp. (in: high G+C Gram-positive bacteria)]
MTSRLVTTKAVPGSPAWLKIVTASKIPSILGISRFKSQFSLWHEMAGTVTSEPIGKAQQDDFDYGHAAELAAAEYWRYKNPGWKLSRAEVQYTNDALGFPNAATVDARGSRGSKRRGVEKKTARDLAEWGDDGTGEVPADYTAQVIWQQIVTGWLDPSDVVLWPQYGKPKIYTIAHDPVVAELILDRVREWNASLAAGIPPELDDSISTYATVRRLHPDIDDREVQLDPDLAHDYLTTVSEEKDVAKRLTGVKSRVLDAMAGARTAKAGGLLIATRSPHGKGIALKSNTKADPAEIERPAA